MKRETDESNRLSNQKFSEEEEETNPSSDHIFKTPQKPNNHNKDHSATPSLVLNNHFVPDEMDINRQHSKCTHSMFEGLPIGLYCMTLDGQFLQANPAFLNMFKLPSTNALSEINAQDFYVKREDWIKIISTLENGEEIINFESMQKCFNGDTIWVRESIKKVSWDGNFYFEGSKIDITQEKEATAEIERLYKAERAQRELAEALQHIGSVLSSSLDLDTIFDELLEQVATITHYDAASIMVVEEKRIRVVRAKGYEKYGGAIAEQIPSFSTNVDDFPTFKWIVNNKKALIVDDTQKYKHWVWREEYPCIRSWIGVPICDKDKVIAIFSLDSTKVHFYNEKHIKILTAFAGQASLALQNAKLYSRAMENLERERQLNKISHLISSSLDIDAILQNIIKQTVHTIKADAGNINLINNDGSLAKQYSINMPKDLPSIVKGKGLSWNVFSTCKPILLESYSKHPSAFPGYNIHATIAVPIKMGQECIGTLGIFSFSEERKFSVRDLETVESIARQAAFTIQNANLYEQAQQRAKEAEMLRLAAAAVISPLNLDQVLEQILVNLKKVIEYNSSAVFLIEENGARIVAGKGFPPEKHVVGGLFPLDNPLFIQMEKTKNPIILYDAQNHKHYKKWAGAYEIRGWIGVPLVIREKVIGFLTIDSYKPNTYSESHATIAKAFAHEAAIAIEHARLFEETKKLAIIDELTGIYNRRHFLELLQINMTAAKRYNHHLTLSIFDLDDFKLINDRYGHVIGDKALREIINICKKNLRDVDIVGRYGGEEFMILLPETSITDAVNVIERVRKKIANYKINAGGDLITVTASFGLSYLDPNNLTIDELINNADNALYQAKKIGKNCISIWNADHKNFESEEVQ